MMQHTVERWEMAPGLRISRVLTGLWQIADMERAGRSLDIVGAAQAMAPYVEAGLTTFDMADHYGSAEEIAGQFARTQAQGTVQLFTKWVPEPGPKTRDAVRQAVQRSLNRMQTDSLDLLQFHTWSYADPGYLDCLFYLQEMKEEGIIRHLGLTNVDTAHLRVIVNSGIEIVSNQVCFSLLDQRARTNGMADFCQEHGITLLAFGTLGGGFLTERWLDQPEADWDQLDTWSQMKYRRYIDEVGGWEALQSLLHIIHVVARRHEVSMANIATKYILEQPAVGGVIIGARLGLSVRIKDNLNLFQFTLDEADKHDIETVLATLSPMPGDCGDEYRRPPFLTASGDLSHHLEQSPSPYDAQPQRDGQSHVLSGTIWEDIAGFSRAVRTGDRILVSGTTATHGDRVIGGSDPAAQTHFVIDKIEGALQSLGGKLEDVIRTRVYVGNMEDWEPVARAHGARFRDIKPANTLVQAGLVGSAYLVEIEVEAVILSK
jgi:aryl-alcohol dehydrogenase-like predicted oxidoreductase/enamine deaminase RidA (YjgF/YER057c/UK114 family)